MVMSTVGGAKPSLKLLTFEKYLAIQFIVPSLFVTFQWLQEKVRPVRPEDKRDWQIEEEKKISKKEITDSHQNK